MCALIKIITANKMLNLASYLESICDVVWLRFIIFQAHITEIDNDNKCYTIAKHQCRQPDSHTTHAKMRNILCCYFIITIFLPMCVSVSMCSVLLLFFFFVSKHRKPFFATCVLYLDT